MTVDYCGSRETHYEELHVVTVDYCVSRETQ